jgi:hypothetical protein
MKLRLTKHHNRTPTIYSPNKELLPEHRSRGEIELGHARASITRERNYYGNISEQLEPTLVGPNVGPPTRTSKMFP